MIANIADAQRAQADLLAAIAKAYAHLDSWSVWAKTNAQERANIRNNVDDLTRITREQLGVPRGSLTLRCSSGALSWSRWDAVAREVRSALTVQLAILDSGALSWDRVWDEVVVPTAQDVRQVAEKAADVAPYAAAVAVAVVALVGFVYLSLLVRR